MWIFLLLLFTQVILPVSYLAGQQQNDTVSSKTKSRRMDILPAISYSPETSLTLGVIGIKYLDLTEGNPQIPISNLEFLAVYTLNKQIILESRWELFIDDNKWRVKGEAFYNKYPDRNYGLGNRAAAQVLEIDKKGSADTLNFLNFDSDRIKFSPVVLRELKPGLYLGLQYDMEYLYNMKASASEYYLLNHEALSIKNMPVEGIRSGLGIQLLYDNRDYPLNPIKGSLIAFNNIYYSDVLGSDFRFSLFSLDARHYMNIHKNQTLAVRAYGSANFTNDQIPMRALSRVGGDKFIRGYFRGTYQEQHMAAFEMEYRLPLWEEGTEAKLIQFWKRLGLVGFLGGAQVFDEIGAFHFNRFNLAAGAGLRVLLNPKSRVNIRIDYAIGLSNGSDGIDQRQTGLYFHLGEAF